MTVSIIKVDGRHLMKKFVQFLKTLYKGCDNWVPALERGEYDIFDRKRNGAYEFCDSECFLAFRGYEVVGRVAAIINYKVNEIWHVNEVRFGWLDFINDENVLKALIDAVEQWGVARGCTEIKGPWGFTDMDKEGLLVEGFENLSSFTCLYNYPYYGELLSKIGFRKDVDWIQSVVDVSVIPEIYKYKESVKEKTGVHIADARSTMELGRKYGLEVFRIFNQIFSPLTGFSPLSDMQVDMYLKTYLPILDKRFTIVCVDKDDHPVGFAFAVPSLSMAIKKSGGKLFPFGLFRILKALRNNDTLEWLVVGVAPEHRGDGTLMLMMEHIQMNAIKCGIKRIILNPELEHNVKVRKPLRHMQSETYTRRRCYVKDCR